MYRLGPFLLLIGLFGSITGQNANWKTMKDIKTNNLRAQQRDRNFPRISNDRVTYFGRQKTDEGHFKQTLSKILKVRVPDTEGNRQVRNAISSEMSNLGWIVEEDSFEDNTVVGNVRFTNIIATLNPKAPRRMVLACHYDSKESPNGFLGATDSAVPCAQMINLAKTMKTDLDAQKASGSELSLQFIFFDGEEAFIQWSATDSIYGARHLAQKLQRTGFTHNRISGNELDRMDIFVLLDLLGAKDPVIRSSQAKTDPWFRKLVEIEEAVVNGNRNLPRTRIFAQDPQRNLNIEDDHIPFLQRNVPILHLIATPFPREWHTLADNENAVDYPTVEKLNMIFRIFVSEYLELS